MEEEMLTRGPRDSQPGRQHHRQSRDPERSRGQERVDGDDQPPRSAAESQSQAVHSTESHRGAARGQPAPRGSGSLHYGRGEVEEPSFDFEYEAPPAWRQLLVKWRGYPDSQNSWEPIERLQADCPKAVAIWEQKRRQLRE
ncbi:hypothetical protein PC116_g20601 [Phytophthora cactorum]|nr:hypothetical protein Pcac1_g5668 [Phytophthora cactorum]KAG4231112.1 hypothetical protein PC116_g20601 [Phytophthora cactorum]